MQQDNEMNMYNIEFHECLGSILEEAKNCLLQEENTLVDEKHSQVIIDVQEDGVKILHLIKRRKI